MIAEITDNQVEVAADLLCRFFREEGFVGEREQIRANLDALRNDPHHWAALYTMGGKIAGQRDCHDDALRGVGRLGEIGDLYVLPEFRMKGIARSLVEAAIRWCRSHGCSALAVTITCEGETRHSLSQFYTKFGFTPTGRISSVLRFDPARPD